MNETNTDRPAVIFDMDGVLVDSYQAHFESWNRMLADKGLGISIEDFARHFGRTNQDIIPEIWPDEASDPETVSAWSHDKEIAYREILRERFPAMPGAGELIRSLHDAGFDLAIGSSGPPENIQVVLDCLEHSDCFQAQVTGSDVKRGKPDPEVFLKAAEKLGVEPQRCAVVEDALPGLEAARRAGMLPIALTGTTDPRALAQKAHVVVESLTQLDPDRIRSWLQDR
jgi:beta-phosphoglucomutase